MSLYVKLHGLASNSCGAQYTFFASQEIPFTNETSEDEKKQAVEEHRAGDPETRGTQEKTAIKWAGETQ